MATDDDGYGGGGGDDGGGGGPPPRVEGGGPPRDFPRDPRDARGPGGFGDPGGFVGGGPGGPGGGPGGPNGSAAYAARPSLSMVRGGLAARRRPAHFPELRACVEAWHLGKPYRVDGEVRRMQWVALVLIDMDRQYVVLSKEDLSPQEDDDELAREVELKIESYVGGLGDGMPHHFTVECSFADGEGRTGVEVWTGNLTLPTATPTYGQGPAYSPGGMGYGGAPQHLSRPDSFLATVHKDRIDIMQIAMNAIRETSQFAMDMMREQRATIQRYQDREGAFIVMWQAEEDRKAKLAREARLDDYKIRALDMLVGRLSAIIPVVGVEISRWIKRRREGDKAVSPREDRAYAVLKGIVEAMQRSGMAPNAEALKMMLQQMGVSGDLERDLMDLIEEFVIEEMRKKAEADGKQARGVLGVMIGAPGAGALGDGGAPTSLLGERAGATDAEKKEKE